MSSVVSKLVKLLQNFINITQLAAELLRFIEKI